MGHFIKTLEDARKWRDKVHNNDTNYGDERREMIQAVLDYPDQRMISAMQEAYYADGDFMTVRLPMWSSLMHILGYPVATAAALDAFEDIVWYFDAKMILGVEDEDL